MIVNYNARLGYSERGGDARPYVPRQRRRGGYPIGEVPPDERAWSPPPGGQVPIPLDPYAFNHLGAFGANPGERSSQAGWFLDIIKVGGQFLKDKIPTIIEWVKGNKGTEEAQTVYEALIESNKLTQAQLVELQGAMKTQGTILTFALVGAGLLAMYLLFGKKRASVTA